MYVSVKYSHVKNLLDIFFIDLIVCSCGKYLINLKIWIAEVLIYFASLGHATDYIH